MFRFVVFLALLGVSTAFLFPSSGGCGCAPPPRPCCPPPCPPPCPCAPACAPPPPAPCGCGGGAALPPPPAYPQAPIAVPQYAAPVGNSYAIAGK